ncbi:MAG TPA: hypothetical protein VFU31_11880 [Candidatus Binatia bacterium]|nr:hypothetical protein [Candidatus Binatia bacterium]
MRYKTRDIGRGARSSAGTFAPPMATTMYCRPPAMYVMGRR